MVLMGLSAASRITLAVIIILPYLSPTVAHKFNRVKNVSAFPNVLNHSWPGLSFVQLIPFWEFLS